MGELAPKYLFLLGLYGFVIFALAQVLRGLGRAAALRKPAGPAHESASAPVAAEPPVVVSQAGVLVLGDKQIALPPRGELVVGRDEGCGLVLEDPFVSQRHAMIRCGAGECYITDLGSRNGTRVNGQPIQEAELRDGDRVQVGGTTLVFRARG